MHKALVKSYQLNFKGRLIIFKAVGNSCRFCICSVAKNETYRHIGLVVDELKGGDALIFLLYFFRCREQRRACNITVCLVSWTRARMSCLVCRWILHVCVNSDSVLQCSCCFVGTQLLSANSLLVFTVTYLERFCRFSLHEASKSSRHRTGTVGQAGKSSSS